MENGYCNLIYLIQTKMPGTCNDVFSQRKEKVLIDADIKVGTLRLPALLLFGHQGELRTIVQHSTTCAALNRIICVRSTNFRMLEH